MLPPPIATCRRSSRNPPQADRCVGGFHPPYDASVSGLRSLHYTHIGRVERGASRPSGDTLKRLADALEVTSDYLLEGAPDDAARAKFADRELLRQFQEVERLPDEDKHVVKTLLDAFLTKRHLQALVRGPATEG